MSEQVAEWTDVPEGERFKSGTLCRVVSKNRDTFDARPGSSVVIEDYVDKDDRDDERPYYMFEDVEGRVFGGCVPHDVLEFEKTAEQHAKDYRIPKSKEIVEFLGSAILTEDGPIRIYETNRLKDASSGEWPEPKSDLSHGVEFYGRLEGGRSFGCIVRITAMWETDE